MRIRIVAAVAVLVSAYVHFHLWTDFKSAHVVGPSFMVNAVGGLIIAVLLVTWRTWVPPLLAVGFGAATIAAFLISVYHGLFGWHEHWAGGYVWTAFIAEVVAILAGLAALRGGRPQARQTGRLISEPQ